MPACAVLSCLQAGKYGAAWSKQERHSPFLPYQRVASTQLENEIQAILRLIDLVTPAADGSVVPALVDSRA